MIPSNGARCAPVSCNPPVARCSHADVEITNNNVFTLGLCLKSLAFSSFFVAASLVSGRVHHLKTKNVGMCVLPACISVEK